MLKKVGIGLTIVVVLLVGAALLTPRLIDWNAYKPEITAAVRDATGRDLVIGGDIEVSIFPGISFSASDVRLANADGAEPPDMMTVRRIEGSIKLLPLLGRNLVVERLVVIEPVVALQVNEAGEANWVMSGDATAPTAADEPASGDEGGSPMGDVQLDDVRIEGGLITYVDARTGQEIKARDLSLAASLPKMTEPLSVKGAMTLNDEPVSLEIDVATPSHLMEGERAAVRALIDSERVRVSYDGGVQREPVPGLDGTFDLEIPSAGELAAWLDRPLPQGQPDPGRVRAHAVFVADGGEVAIREARLEGESLQAQATGVLDISGDAPRLELQVESGVLDFDRYLPAPVEGAPERQAQARAEREPPRDLLDGLTDEPFDLSALRNGSADVRVAIEGIRAAGFEVGKTLFVGKLEGGVLDAELQELNLYGGGVTGNLKLDATRDAVALATALNVAGIRTGELGAAVTGGDSPVAGTVSADLALQGEGASPRALAESLNGKLAVDLGGLDLGAAAPGAISGLKVDLDLPGINGSPSLAGSLVYDKERVDFKATLDPLPVVLSENRFALDLQVDSRPVSLSYGGAVLREPVAGLDGTFDLTVPSVGRLAGWLGKPLAQGQPDPGPLKARAVFAGEGGRVEIREAIIEGDALKAEARGSWEQQGDVTRLVLDATAGVIDLDRYLPQGDASGAGDAPAPASDGTILSSLPNEPLDLSMLRSLEADINLALDGLRVSGREIGRTVVAADIDKGALDAEIQELAAFGGSIAGELSLDASGNVPSYALALNASGVDLGAALGGGGAPPSLQGRITAAVDAKGTGGSPRALVASTVAEVSGQAAELVIAGEPPRRLEQVTFSASVPGFDSPVTAQGTGRYEGEEVEIALQLDPLNKILGGERFAADLGIDSALLKAQYKGAVQQRPVAGLDGRLTASAPEVGRLLAWLGNPIPPGQPEPGPLEVNAVLAADGAVVALKEASVQGKALQATATASYDGSAETPRLNAQVDIARADLDAYLPASAGGGGGDAGAGEAPGAGGWSTEPIDLGILSAANGDIALNLRDVRFRGLDVQSGRIGTRLENGVLDAAVEELKVAEGTVAGKVKVDGTSGAAIGYDLTVSGLNARPVLKAFVGTERLGGRTEFRTEGSARGASQRDLVSSLNGSGELRFFDGAIYGINLAALLRQVGSLGLQGGEEQKTDFAELGGTFTIRNGVFENNDLKMLAPLVRLNGGGTSNLPARTIDYRVDGRLVASLEGQGGEEALAGLPVPIRIGGTFDNPTYEIDWKSVLEAAARDPERLKKMPGDLLGAAEELGVNLKGLGDGDGIGGVLKSLPGLGGTGQSSTGSQPALPIDPLRGLLGGKRGDRGSAESQTEGAAEQGSETREEAPAASGETQPTGEAAPETQEPEASQPERERRGNPLEQQLRGLFGR